MSDSAIKIISNPYEKNVSFMEWDGNGSWVAIDQLLSRNSDLLSARFIEGFFPFNVKEIVDTIVNEYGGRDERLTIVFEGGDDEFEELRLACKDHSYEWGIEVERSPRKLHNAREVRPKILAILEGLNETIEKYIQEDNDAVSVLAKIPDASSKRIPLCVLGNYSAGKSSFINALIGFELLPSGPQVVTTKVFQITKSSWQDEAHIRFSVGSTKIDLVYNSTGLVPNPTLEGTAFYDQLLTALESLDCDSWVSQMNRTLMFLNENSSSKAGEPISELVEIETPFCANDSWAQKDEFVIFDTPGSNSASYEEHVQVIINAMNNLSNGMLLFVAGYETLDTKDNLELIKVIRGLDAIDERFAMIVVNKAESADLPSGNMGFFEAVKEKILESAIPLNLLGQGIYFASSVVALGAKTDGKLSNENYKKVFNQNKNSFSDPSDSHYTMLYRYNILPGQMEERITRESESCNNILLANSGIYGIEQGILRFAEKYTAYNKCTQMLNGLRKIAVTTIVDIEKESHAIERRIEERQERLEIERSSLVDSLERLSVELKTLAIDGYPAAISSKINSEQWFITLARLQQEEEVLSRKSGDEYTLSDVKDAANEAANAIRENFLNRVGDAVRTVDGLSIIQAMQGFVDDVAEARGRRQELGDTQRSVDRQTATRLSAVIQSRFDKMIKYMEQEVDFQSRIYWEERASEARRVLFDQATDGLLSLDEHEELGIEIGFPSLSSCSKEAELLFTKRRLESSLKVRDLVLFESDRLNLNRARKLFNSEIERAFTEVCESIGSSHRVAYEEWLDVLLETITLNVASYSPGLSELVEEIQSDKERLEEQANDLATIKQGQAQVEQLVGWGE